MVAVSAGSAIKTSYFEASESVSSWLFYSSVSSSLDWLDWFEVRAMVGSWFVLA